MTETSNKLADAAAKLFSHPANVLFASNEREIHTAGYIVRMPQFLL